MNDDWTLTGAQALWMLRHHTVIERGLAGDAPEADTEVVRELAASDDYKALFGVMGLDEAHDRYETMREDGRAY